MDTPPIKERYQEKSVIIHRDENGFGIRVGGQNPVFVDHVHENGAAWKAGVRKDDRIIKVNGTLVKSYDHQGVVQMIQNCSPFVNLTLHSPEKPVDCLNSSVGHPYTLGVDQTNGNMIAVTGLDNHQASNIHHSYNPSASVHLNSRRHVHPHSFQGNLNWLLDIGDDLFQDTQQKQSLQHQQEQPIIGSGISKLIVSGPTPLSHSNSSSSLSSASIRHNRSQSNNNTRDNPYYYYKTASQDKLADTTSSASSTATLCNSSDPATASITTSSSTASLLGNADQATATTTTASTSGNTTKPSSSMVRSRSSSKMSTRSTTSKYAKARNLRTRLVEDLRSLAITNSQTTPSSLSTSPSSSDLSDCDDPEPPGTRLGEPAGLTLDGSHLSSSPNSSNTIMIGSTAAAAAALGLNLNLSSSSHHSQQQQGAFTISSNNNKSVKFTTRRLEIIRELVDTEKTHTEKLKQLNDLLYKPIKAENLIPADQLKMVFSCHKTLFKIHRQIYKKLLAAQVNYSEQHLRHFHQHLQEPLVGKALLEIFEGDLGKRLEKAASLFCACQSTNTDLLNRITRKDTKSGEFLAQVANQQMLGRLGIKDLLASCFQRLTKYPLLLDNLLKATPNLQVPGVNLPSVASVQPVVPTLIHSKSLSEGSIAIPLNSLSEKNSDESLSSNSQIDENANQNVSAAGPTATNKGLHDESLSPNKSIDVSSSSRLQWSASPTSLVPKQTENNNHHSTSNSLNNDCIAPSVGSSSGQQNPFGLTATITNSLCDEYAYERFCIERSLQSSRQILIHVNEAVNKAMAQNKLKEIWKKTDKIPRLSVIDIDCEQVLHEGSLTLRLNRRQFEVYVLLLTHYLVILTRENQDKYKLKYFASDGKSKPNELLSPIFNIDEHLVTRDSATDENGFYLLCKRKDDERIFEFASQSPLERAKWKEKIHMAQLYNFAVVPDDDNTLTRYTELISLTNSSNTPNNIEQSPTGSLAASTTTTAPCKESANTSSGSSATTIYNNKCTESAAATTTSTTTTTTTSATTATTAASAAATLVE